MIYNVDPGLKLTGIHKSFGSRSVLRGVDMTAHRGRVLGLLGANGAGKSTLINIATGLIPADKGDIRVAGIDIAHQRHGLGSHIGIAPQDLGIYPQLSARENLISFAHLSGMRHQRAKARANEVLELLGLENCALPPAGVLSGGQQRRLHTAIALVHRPPVLFLDEPTVGADISARADILAVVRQLASDGATVIYTTHYLPELEQLDPDIAVLNSGKIVAHGPLENIIDQYARPTVRLHFHDQAPHIAGWQSTGTILEPTKPVTNPGAVIAEVLAAPAIQHHQLTDIEMVRADLESAFRALTGASPQPPVDTQPERDNHVVMA